MQYICMPRLSNRQHTVKCIICQLAGMPIKEMKPSKYIHGFYKFITNSLALHTITNPNWIHFFSFAAVPVNVLSIQMHTQHNTYSKSLPKLNKKNKNRMSIMWTMKRWNDERMAWQRTFFSDSINHTANCKR